MSASASIGIRPGAGRDDLAAALRAARGRLGLVTLLLGLAGLAWWETADQMTGMSAAPSADLGTLGWFLGIWVVMMAAMMLPSLAPTTALYARMTRRRGYSHPLLFTASYLLVWGAAGLTAYGILDLGRVAFGAALRWDTGGRWLAAAALATAAIYELTPLKNICLGKCRSPLAFLLGSWRDGWRGAVEMGCRHAAWCLGCCWALMAALFALGVMSLQWMAVVAALIAVEKTVPWRRTATYGVAATLMLLALAVAIAPHDVPGLVLPSAGMHGAQTMSSMR